MDTFSHPSSRTVSQLVSPPSPADQWETGSKLLPKGEKSKYGGQKVACCLESGRLQAKRCESNPLPELILSVISMSSWHRVGCGWSVSPVSGFGHHSNPWTGKISGCKPASVVVFKLASSCNPEITSSYKRVIHGLDNLWFANPWIAVLSEPIHGITRHPPVLINV